MALNPFDDAVQTLDAPPAMPTAAAPLPTTPDRGPSQEFLDTLDSLKTGRTQQLRAATIHAQDVAPDRAADVLRLSTVTGLGPDVVARNYDDLSKRHKVEAVPYDALQQQTPHLASWVAANPLHAAVAADDTSPGGQAMDHLGTLEWLVSMPSRAVAQAINEERASSLRGTALLRDLTPAEQDQLNAYTYHASLDGSLGVGDSWFKGALTKSMKLLTALTVPETLPAAAGLLLGGAVGSIVPGVGTVAGATVGAEAGYTYGLGKSAFLTSAGSSYETYRRITDATGQPLDPHIAKLAALTNGAINAGLMTVGGAVIGKGIGAGAEKIGGLFTRDTIAAALKNPTVVQRLGTLAGTYATTMTEGVALMAAMQAGDILVSEIAKTTQAQPVHRTVGQAAGEIGTAATEAVQSFALIAGAGPALGLTQEALRAARGNVTPAFVEALGEGIAQSKTAQRAPGAVENLVSRAAGDQTWYLPVDSWTAYWQAHGEDPAAKAATLTGKPDAYAEAQRTNTDLAVSPGRFATQLANTEHNAFFKDELRLGPREMNGRESADWLAAEQQRAAEPPPEPAALEQAHQAVIDMQTAAGTPVDVAEANAALVRAAFGTTAERANLDPLTEYQRRDLSVQGAVTQAVPAGLLGTEAAPASEAPAGAPVAAGDATAGPVTDLSPDAAIARLTDQAPVQERRQAAGVGPGGVERRIATTETPAGFTPQQSIAERAAALRAENPQIDQQAAEARAKALAAGRIPEPIGRPQSPLGQAIVDTVQAATTPASEKPAFRDEIARMQKKAETWRQSVTAAFNSPGGARTVNAAGVQHLVHLSTAEPGKIQITSLDADGTPTGHRVVSDIAEAARELAGETLLPGVKVDTNETPAQTEARYGPEPLTRQSPDPSGESGRPGVAASRPRERETPEQFAERKREHTAAVVADLLDAARALDPAIDVARLTDEINYRLQTYDDLKALEAESGHDPHDLLRAIAANGGLGDQKASGYEGEVRWLKDGLKFGAVRGADNKLIQIFRKTERRGAGFKQGLGVDGMLEALQQDARFAWLQSVNHLIDAVGDAIRYRPEDVAGVLPGTDELRAAVQIKADEPWWLDPWRNAPEHVDTADVSFDFGANAPGDVLDTGEVQPRLPGDVGAVRDITNATPEMPIPFALMGETADVPATAADLPLGEEPSKTFFQPGQQEPPPRAAITIGPDGKTTINLFEHADLTSFLHEAGHLFLDTLGAFEDQLKALDPATLTPQQQQLLADHQALLTTLGVESKDQITRAHHEELANLFTDYLKEGKAPSVALQPAFARFRAWLLDVYKALRQAKTPLTDEVRRVFDRLLASDQAIADAEARRGQQQFFATADEAGMSPERFAIYQETLAAAHREAQQTLDQQLLQDVRRESTARWKADQTRIQAEVTAELEQQPVYKALAAIRKGAHPDGSPLIEGQDPEPLTLSRGLVADRYPQLNVPADLLTADGRDPDLVAELVGYPSGRALLNAIADAPPLRRVIAEETRSRLWQQHGSTLLDGTLPDKADAAVANDRRADVVRMELQALWAKANPEAPAAARRGDTHAEQERAYERRWFEAEAKLRIAIAEGRKQVEIDNLRQQVSTLKAKARGGAAAIARGIPSADAIRTAAESRIDSLPLRAVKPAEFWAAARRAGQAAVDHAARQDIPSAITAKTQELVSLAHYRAAEAARTAVDEALTTFQQFNKSDATIAQTRNLDLVQAGRAVLASVGLGRRPAERIESYLTQLRTYDPDLHASLLDQIQAATPADAVRDYRDLSYGAFKALSESVDALWSLARSTEAIEVGGEKLQLRDVRNQILGKLHEFSDPRVKAGYTQAVSGWDRVKVGLLGFRARGRRVEDWVTVVDNGREGIARRAVYDPINAGAVAYDGQRAELATRYAELAATLDADKRVTKIAAPELRSPEYPQGYTFNSKHEELLGALLHTGNGWAPGSNGDKLLRGRGWTKDGWDAFVGRMTREGVLTKADFDFVQGVWDLQESLKPAAQAVHKTRFGRYFDEVTAVPIDTPWGSYRGGYYPAIADPFITPLAADRAEANSLLEGGGGGTTMFPSVGRGFTQTRTEGYAKPLILDASQVLSHVNSVLRFIHLSGPVHDVARLILHPEFRGALDAVDPAAVSDLLVPYLQRAARQTMFTPLQGKAGRAADAVAREIRNRGSMQIIALNATVLAEQFTHFPSVLAHGDVEPGALLAGVWRLSRDPKGLLTEIHDASPYMKTRESAGLVEAHAAIDRILLDPNPAQRGAQWVQDHSTVLMRGIQAGMDAATWQAVYSKVAAEPGMTHDAAVLRADSAVRQALGSYRPQDRAALEGGSQMVGLLNQFYGFFNTKLNMLGTEALLTSRLGLQRSLARGFGVYVFGFMIPALLGEGIKNAMKGGSPIAQHPDEDAAIALARFWGVSQLKMGARMIPFGGAAVEVAAQAFLPGRGRSLLNAPSITMVENALHAPGEAYRALTDTNTRTHAQNAKAITDFFTMLGLLSNLPMRPVGQAVNLLHDTAGAQP